MGTKSLPLRVALTVSAVWITSILALVVVAIGRAPSFEAEAKQPCTQFLIPLARPVEQAIMQLDSRLWFPVLRWQDARSRQDITPFRSHEQALRCTDLEQRASMFLLARQQGVITPRIAVHRRRLALLLLLPCCLFVVLYYLVFPNRTTRGTRTASLPKRAP
jgi:hypothetical protein